jgi:DNA modification methylase
MKYELLNIDNTRYFAKEKFDFVFCDMIYENTRVDKWIFKYWQTVRENGIFIVMTDYHTDWLVRWYFETNTMLNDAVFINHLVWKNEWGNHPKRSMHQCYDDILVYAKGRDYKFYPERIQVPKATANTRLNPSGRITKTATAWIDDICLTTTSKERVKKEDGHLIQWQKPLKLFDRIVPQFTDFGDSVLDPFMGSGSLGEWCVVNDRNYTGIELDKQVFDLAEKRIKNAYDISVQV